MENFNLSKFSTIFCMVAWTLVTIISFVKGEASLVSLALMNAAYLCLASEHLMETCGK